MAVVYVFSRILYILMNRCIHIARISSPRILSWDSILLFIKKHFVLNDLDAVILEKSMTHVVTEQGHPRLCSHCTQAVDEDILLNLSTVQQSVIKHN